MNKYDFYDYNKAKELKDNCHRCRLHSGLSTDTKTEKEKQRIGEASRRGMIEYWRKKNQRHKETKAHE